MKSDLETFNREMASLLGTPVYPVIGESLSMFHMRLCSLRYLPAGNQ